jgi:hypothetical protein
VTNPHSDVASVFMFVVVAIALAAIFYVAMTHQWTGAATLPEVRISAEPEPRASPAPIPTVALPSGHAPSGGARGSN